MTVAGNTYEIETSDAAFELSTLGGLNIGDIVTLLLGRDGKVAAALPADEYATGVAGVVTAVGTGTYYNAVGNAYTARTITVPATDGASGASASRRLPRSASATTDITSRRLQGAGAMAARLAIAPWRFPYRPAFPHEAVGRDCAL